MPPRGDLSQGPSLVRRGGARALASRLEERRPPLAAGPTAASSTVSDLAQKFSGAELVRAAIQSHNPQDFDGQPLPSGASVSSHALSSLMGEASHLGSQPLSSGSAGRKRPADDAAIDLRLRQRPHHPLPEELESVALAHPRLYKENDLAYARRLNGLSQQGEATARVGEQPLSFAQLSMLSGVIEGSLIRDLARDQ